MHISNLTSETPSDQPDAIDLDRGVLLPLRALMITISVSLAAILAFELLSPGRLATAIAGAFR